MTTYLNWLPSLSVGTYFGYAGENSENNKPHSDISTQTTQNENTKMFGFWSEMFGKAPKIEKYSPENIRRLSDLLKKQSKNGNDDSVVDVLKEMTQVLVWGDQHNQTILDYFFENNIHHIILNLLKQTKSPNITNQILQTMNILVENIHDLTSLYFLLSKNYVNEIICHKFDFSNDEILAYYIIFLRTLSLKLDSSTLYFFFNERHNDFPLYSEAIKFFKSDDSMIRTAVRTITLNIFAVNNAQTQEFILDRNASPYFSNLVNFISDFSRTLDEISDSMDYYKRYQTFNYYLVEHCDNFYYINDIIKLENERMNQELTSHLMDLLLKPIYADSLVKREFLPYKQATRINSVVALALLCHVLYIFHHPPLVTATVAMLFSNSPELMDYPQSPRLDGSYANPSTLFKNRNLYREAIMGFLTPEIPEDSDHDYFDMNTLPALCLIYMSCRNHAIAPDILLAAEVYPQKLLKTRRLMTSLASSYEDLSTSHHISLRQGYSFDTSSIASSVTSSSQSKPIFTDDLDDESLQSPISSRADHGSFADDIDEFSYSIPSIKITEIQPQVKSYRAVLIQNILTLLCMYYRLCRPITLQMATEVLLELLYYNGSGECLTSEQTEMINRTEKELQERVKAYFLNDSEFQLEEFEKAVNESMFGGDKYVGEIIMNAKLLFPPPLSNPLPAMSANSSKKNSTEPEISNEIIRDIKTLHLLRQTRLLLSRKMILEEPPFEEEEYIEEEDENTDELVYHSELIDERFVSAHQQMYSSISENGDDKNTRQRRDTKDSTSSWVSINGFDKRKKSILDKLGIQL
ncbi:hypothetical protein RclHR1_05430005 [Rhizophagus clarus]|uniref:Protein CLEC16A isoform X2 n=1 Tax=Rhizophagus clarus TaxID=94130 RepID=A0A2Z6RZR9_9GLOM|nr:hypothetical protein RclHR1_05430005 [Rhizophagus clarus]GES98313.1 protein CLEC16A isoform X2 [Rhizophagus clarus]